MLKVQIVAAADDFGALQPVQADNIKGVDASTCADELTAVREALRFIDSQKLDALPVTYGRGHITLAKGDDVRQKADELFYSACCFDLYEIRSFKDPEFKFGEPVQAGNITEAVHSALRISQRFGAKVSFTFNGVAVPPVEQKGEITQNDIRTAVDSYSKAWDRRFKR